MGYVYEKNERFAEKQIGVIMSIKKKQLKSGTKYSFTLRYTDIYGNTNNTLQRDMTQKKKQKQKKLDLE